jgi:hypothetical protein
MVIGNTNSRLLYQLYTSACVGILLHINGMFTMGNWKNRRRTEKPMAKRKGQVNKLWSTMHYEETYKDQAMQTPLKIGTEIWCAGIKSFCSD